MERGKLEQAVLEMTEEELRTNLLYLARSVDEGELPDAITVLSIFDRTCECVHDPLPPRE